jgi:Protein of unknown function (DUF2946)
MRRRLRAVVSIVLFAVVVQLVAPIAAFRAVAYAASDPLYMASICSGADDTHTAPAQSRHDQDGCCVFCAACHGGGVAAEPLLPIFVSLQRSYQRVFWLKAEYHRPIARLGAHTQARAPPSIS